VAVKLVIQIPCFNEESSLPVTLAELPRAIEGIDEIEVLIVNDGSTDRTAEVALECGADHVINLFPKQGLASAFAAGLEAALRRGADIIVNTDGDNQYCAADIPSLLRPILEREAEIVIGARPIEQIDDFSNTKKLLQRLGSWVVRRISGTNVPDSPSGFRAISRSAAVRLNVFSEYTYTLETVIQAGLKSIPIASVPVRTNPNMRPSRLVRSVPSYLLQSLVTMLRIFMLYRPLQFFIGLAAVPFSGGMILMLRWLLLFLFVDPNRVHAPSLIVASVLLFLAFQLATLGLVADLMAANRKLLEEMQVRLRHSDLDSANRPSQ